MNEIELCCPSCGSREIHFRKTRGDYSCDMCEHNFTVEDKSVREFNAFLEKKKRRIFLSYGRLDASDLAAKLKADLESAGYEVWQDTNMIRAGKSWEQEILEGLKTTDLMIAVLSPHAVRTAETSNNPDSIDSVCLDEISFARFSKPSTPIIPVMAIACEPPFCIFRLDYIDMCSWKQSEQKYETGFNRLIEAINSTLKGEIRYRAWEQQLKPWDFSSFLNEKRKYFCARQWIFDEIEAWRKRSNERALIITGEPGIGKSAIVAELVHRNPDGQMLAYHCCQSGAAATLSASRFVRNIAALIASKIGKYADMLSQPAISEILTEEACAADPLSAFEGGILTPLESVPAPDATRYILIDAINESLELNEKHGILDILASRLMRLPSWLRLVITTRKNREILDRLKGVRTIEVSANDPRNISDARTYIDLRSKELAIETLLLTQNLSYVFFRKNLEIKSASNFLYLYNAFREIELNPGKTDYFFEKIPSGLYAQYLEFFKRHFPDEKSFERVKTLLEVLIAADIPLASNILLSIIESHESNYLSSALRELSAYLIEGEAGYELYHKSLADWLTSDELKGAFYFINTQNGHNRIAQYCYNAYISKKETLPEFALKHAIANLIKSGRWKEIEQILTDPEFITQKCCQAMVYGLLNDYEMCLSNVSESLAHVSLIFKSGSYYFQCPSCGTINLTQKNLSNAETACQHCRGKIFTNDFILETDAINIENLCQRQQSIKVSTQAATQERLTKNVSEFYRFIRKYAHIFQKFPGQIYDYIFNIDERNPVRPIIESYRNAYKKTWLLYANEPERKNSNILTFSAHESAVCYAGVSADNKLMASGATDGIVKIWNYKTGENINSFTAHKSKITYCAFSPDGRFLVTAAEWPDNAIKVWDAKTFEDIFELCGHEAGISGCAFSPDGSKLASVSHDKTVKIWNMTLACEIKTLSGHAGDVLCCAFSPDAKTIATGGKDRALILWDAQSYSKLATINSPKGEITACAFSPDSKKIALISSERVLKLFEIKSNKELPAPEPYTKAPVSIAFSSDNKALFVAFADKSVEVIDCNTFNIIASYNENKSGASAVFPTAWPREFITAGTDGCLRIWKYDAKKDGPQQPETPKTHVFTITPDGKKIIAALYDKTISIFEKDRMETAGALYPNMPQIKSITLHPSSKVYLTATLDATLREFHSFNKKEGVEKRFASEINQCIFSCDGTKLAIKCSDGELKLIDYKNQKDIPLNISRGESALSIAFSPDSQLFAYTCDSGITRFLDLYSHCEKSRIANESPANIFTFSPDGLKFALSCEKKIKIYDAKEFKQCAELSGHAHFIRSIALSPDCRFAITSAGLGENGELKLWDVINYQEIKTFGQFGEFYKFPNFSCDSKYALAIANANKLNIYKVPKGELVATFYDETDFASAQWSPNKPQIVSCGSNGIFYIIEPRNIEQGPPYAMAFSPAGSWWKRWSNQSGSKIFYFCSFCANWQETGHDNAGREVKCPECGCQTIIYQNTFAMDINSIKEYWKSIQ